PKMKEYIFGERNGIYIIDLQKTLKMFKAAAQFVSDLATEGRTLLFVGTKRQAQEAIAEEAQRCGMFYVNHRWLGGTLTNWITLQRSVNRYKELEAMEEDGRMEAMLKKEAIRLRRELRHYRENLVGIKDLPGLPDAMFVIDADKEENAVLEARKLFIPVVAVVDTNCDPDPIDHVIPGNDDALRAIRLFASKIADAVLAGRALYEQAQIEAAKAEEIEAGAGVDGQAAAEYAGTPEELEDVAEVYDPNEALPPHLRPHAVPETGEPSEETPAPVETADAPETPPDQESAPEAPAEALPEEPTGSTTG
ncbi:MAG: 30S ribosomal protein S2, partial [Terriglobia bacterium]